MAKPYVMVGSSIGNTARVLNVFFNQLGMFVKVTVYAITKANTVVMTELIMLTLQLLKKAVQIFPPEKTALKFTKENECLYSNAFFNNVNAGHAIKMQKKIKTE